MAQHFPQCINIEVTGNGTQKPPPGVAGTELYRAGDPGLVFDIYHINGQAYEIPGPSLTFGEQDHAVMRRGWDDVVAFIGDFMEHWNSTYQALHPLVTTNSSSLLPQSLSDR